MIAWLVGLVLSLGVGVSLGMLGGGGSILTLPILLYVLGIEPRAAIATSLVVVGVTSLASLLPRARREQVAWRTGLEFGLASMATAFVGGKLGHRLPTEALLVAFAVLLLVTGLAMLRGRSGATPGVAGRGRAVVVGLLVGLLTGVLGAGGGFVIVPALSLLMGLAMPAAVATSLLLIGLNSLTAFAAQASTVAIEPGPTALLTAVTVLGSLLGAHLATRLRPDALRRAFAALVLVMAVVMLARQASLALGAAGLLVALAGAWWVLRSLPRPASA